MINFSFEISSLCVQVGRFYIMSMAMNHIAAFVDKTPFIVSSFYKFIEELHHNFVDFSNVNRLGFSYQIEVYWVDAF